MGVTRRLLEIRFLLNSSSVAMLSLLIGIARPLVIPGSQNMVEVIADLNIIDHAIATRTTQHVTPSETLYPSVFRVSFWLPYIKHQSSNSNLDDPNLCGDWRLRPRFCPEEYIRTRTNVYCSLNASCHYKRKICDKVFERCRRACNRKRKL